MCTLLKILVLFVPSDLKEIFYCKTMTYFHTYCSLRIFRSPTPQPSAVYFSFFQDFYKTSGPTLLLTLAAMVCLLGLYFLCKLAEEFCKGAPQGRRRRLREGKTDFQSGICARCRDATLGSGVTRYQIGALISEIKVPNVVVGRENTPTNAMAFVLVETRPLAL